MVRKKRMVDEGISNIELRKKQKEREGLKKFLNEAINMTDKFPVTINSTKDRHTCVAYTVRIGSK